MLSNPDAPHSFPPVPGGGDRDGRDTEVKRERQRMRRRGRKDVRDKRKKREKPLKETKEVNPDSVCGIYLCSSVPWVKCVCASLSHNQGQVA